MFLFSIQFTLRIFFAAFHCLVLASFCSSKNPDLIQWAMFVCNQNTHSLCVRHSKVEIEKIDCRRANTCKGIHILYFVTKRIFRFLSFEMFTIAQASRNKAQFFVVSLSLFTETKLMC